MTDDLVISAFNKAIITRGLKKEGIFHSDRGSQYTSNDFELSSNDKCLFFIILKLLSE